MCSLLNRLKSLIEKQYAKVKANPPATPCAELGGVDSRFSVGLVDIYALTKQTEVTDNLIESYRCCMCRSLPGHLWVASTQLTNTLFAYEQQYWHENMVTVVSEWPHVQVAKNFTHHIFMFGYGYVKQIVYCC